MKRYAAHLPTLLLLGLSVTTVTAQTAGEIDKKYKAEGGGYVVRPEVLMTAKFADSGQMCEATIKARPTPGVEAREEGLMDSGDGTWMMPWGIVDAVIKELAHVSGHSSHRPMLTFSGGCTSVRLDVYGEVHIYTTVVCVAGGGSGVREVKVLWVRRGCSGSSHPQSNNFIQRTRGFAQKMLALSPR